MRKTLAAFIAVSGLAGLAYAAPTRAGRCAGPDTINFEPAEMLQIQDQFRERLPQRDRARLDQALPHTSDGRIAGCAGRDGASCDNYAYVMAFKATGLMDRFVASICPARQ